MGKAAGLRVDGADVVPSACRKDNEALFLDRTGYGK